MSNHAKQETRRGFLWSGVGAVAATRMFSAGEASAASPQEPAVRAAHSVLSRLLAERAEAFDLAWMPPEKGHQVYEVTASRGRVEIKGSSGVALSRGVYMYLREACNAMITWSGRHLSLPTRFPDFTPRRVVCPYRFVQYYNVCCYGYSTPFWHWERWERELDWMALHGVTMPLAMEGQEAIWQGVWTSLGVTQAELDRFSTGPGHLPWHRMGNLDNFDGPLPQGWIKQKQALQAKILARMRELGMTPVVPAFSGFVPQGFKRVYPQARTFTSIWDRNMPRASRTFILHPSEADWYKEIGKRFIREYHNAFGPAEYYLADTFNELQVPVSAEHRNEELAQFARTVYEGILAGNPNGTWVMQGWLFSNDAKFWDNQSIAAFLSTVPNDRMLILDYLGDAESGKEETDWTARNQWRKHQAYFGKLWINGALHNFGGNNNVKGHLPLVALQPAQVLASPDKGNLAGWGMDPEGIENNEAVFELMTDMGWSEKAIDLKTWIAAYCHARYGGYPPVMEEAWSLLLESVYTRPRAGNSGHAWQARPSLEPVALNVECGPVFQQAVERFLSCAAQLQSSQLYRNDLIELVAQSAGGSVDRRLAAACAAHKAGQADSRDRKAEQAMEMLLRIDALMNLRVDRRLETWTGDARRWGSAPDEAAYYDANARRLVTFWGWGSLGDYASRVWGGLIRDYYVGRWRAWFRSLQQNQPLTAASLDLWEETWLSSPYQPSAPLPVADLAGEARRMLDLGREWERDS
jgi:alpha-N-acetylglucosaminidase